MTADGKATGPDAEGGPEATSKARRPAALRNLVGRSKLLPMPVCARPQRSSQETAV